MKIVLFDIDDTIAYSRWRNVVKPPSGTWDEYHSASVNDKPNLEVVDLITTLSSAGYTCLGLTRRPEKWRSTTNLWMMNHKVQLAWYFMAADKEYGNLVEVKLAMIEAHFTEAQRRDIQFIVDDDPELCAAITEKFGFSTLQYRGRARN
jgi:hypothetical protein